MARNWKDWSLKLDDAKSRNADHADQLRRKLEDVFDASVDAEKSAEDSEDREWELSPMDQ